MIMADVDHFKIYNDAHGHQAGRRFVAERGKDFPPLMREMDLVRATAARNLRSFFRERP